MKYTTLIYLSFTFLSLDSWGQSDLYRSKGFYNITKVSTGIFTKVDEQNQIGASSSYNNSYVFAMNSSLGLHLGTFGVSQLGLNPARRPRRSAVMGLEAGIGMVRYYQPSLTVIPTSLGLKIFFSRIDNSLYLAAGGHGSILVRATLKTPKASILVWATNSFCSILNVSLLNFSMNNDSLI